MTAPIKFRPITLLELLWHIFVGLLWTISHWEERIKFGSLNWIKLKKTADSISGFTYDKWYDRSRLAPFARIFACIGDVLMDEWFVLLISVGTLVCWVWFFDIWIYGWISFIWTIYWGYPTKFIHWYMSVAVRLFNIPFRDCNRIYTLIHGLCLMDIMDIIYSF